MADMTLPITYFAFLLGLGVIVANVMKKARIPDSFFLLILGLFLGPTLFKNPFIANNLHIVLVDMSVMGNIPDFLRLLALIIVVFSGTFNLKLRTFKKFSDVSIILAFLGVIVNTIVLGVAAMLIFGIDPLIAFLLSAVISGTATEVLYPLEDTLKDKYGEAFTTLKMESILNSPLSVLLPVMFMGMVTMQPGATIEPMKYISLFWQQVAAGVGTGIILGYTIPKILKGMLNEYTPLWILSIALITYALAENVGGSGMLAVATCGLIAGNVSTGKSKIYARRFDDYLSEMLRISVFTMMGASVFLNLTVNEFLLTILFFLISVAIRPVFVLFVTKRMGLEFERGSMMLISYVNPKGLSSAAMAPIVAGVVISAGKAGIAALMTNIIFMTMALSILFSSMFAIFISGERSFTFSPGIKTLSKDKERDESFKEINDI